MQKLHNPLSEIFAKLADMGLVKSNL